MDLVWRTSGWVRLRLTSGDCTRRLREISRQIRIEAIDWRSDVAVEFSVSRQDADRIRIREGEELERIGSGGGPRLLRWLMNWKITAAALLLLGVLTWALPTRIWFLRVEGNGEVPARLILEKAEEAGITFGAARKDVRSEQLKNHLLHEIPQLRWAGINTFGCGAVISVTPRAEQEEAAQTEPGDLVARTDALVTDISVETGTGLTGPGRTVRQGDVLISGTADLGLLIRTDRAEGEVYGITNRKITAVLPDHVLQRHRTGEKITRCALLIGKKRVNFSNDSGILHGTCVKMRKVQYLKLPGGFSLPVALVTETYFLCETSEDLRSGDETSLLTFAREQVRSDMIAGTILGETVTTGSNSLEAVFECREMIAVFRPGVYLERDTNDRENGERGAG